LLSKYDFPGDERAYHQRFLLYWRLRGSSTSASQPSCVWAEALDSYIPTPERAIDGAFLMQLKTYSPSPGRGTVVTGRIERGIVKVVKNLKSSASANAKTTCTGVEMFRKLLDQGQAGDNVGVLLRGTSAKKLSAGQVLCKPVSIKPHHQVHCRNLRAGQR